MFPADYALNVVDLGRAAEERGFESLFVPEHTHIPAIRETPWPQGGELPREYSHTLDPFVALAAVCAATNRIKLGYEYPYQWSNTDDHIKHWCFTLPIDETTSRAIFLFYFAHDLIKLPGYAHAGVATVWLVDVSRRVVHVFTEPRPAERRYASERTLRARDTLDAGVPCVAPLDVGELFAVLER